MEQPSSFTVFNDIINSISAIFGTYILNPYILSPWPYMKFLVFGDISEAKKASKIHKLLFFTNIFIALRPFFLGLD